MFRFDRTAPLLTALAVLCFAAFVSAEEFGETVRLDGDEVEIVNLIGHVDVVRGGDEFVVEIEVKGDDARRDDFEFVTERVDGATRLTVVFPVDDERTYIYPPMGRGKSQFTFRDDGNDGSVWERIAGALGGRKITVKGKGRGYEGWADLTVRIPDGSDAVVKLGCGDIRAEDVSADVTLDTSSGPISAERMRGVLVCDTGSGHVDVADCEGEITVDTGSGHVTGRKLSGGKVLVDTGSGHVELTEVDCRKLDVDTGSGRVEAVKVSCDAARIDTGSGSVHLQLDRMGSGRFLLDTGSGGVTLILPRDASCRVSCDTGSGGIDVDVPGVDVDRPERDEASFTVGGGDARVILDTGSGGIRVKTAS